MEPVPQSYRTTLSPLQSTMKRLFDIVVACLGLVVCFLPMLVCYILIKKEDCGPVIFKQERVGYQGMPFFILKFRTMTTDSEREGPQLSDGTADNRLTRIGRFLRATHLDELPQFYNVLKGEMSVVGFRPERRHFINLISEQDARYHYLYQLRPGLTSIATIRNGYTHNTAEMLRRLRYDIFYTTHASFGLDLKIIWLTVTYFFRNLFSYKNK